MAIKRNKVDYNSIAWNTFRRLRLLLWHQPNRKKTFFSNLHIVLLIFRPKIHRDIKFWRISSVWKYSKKSNERLNESSAINRAIKLNEDEKKNCFANLSPSTILTFRRWGTSRVCVCVFVDKCKIKSRRTSFKFCAQTAKSLKKINLSNANYNQNSSIRVYFSCDDEEKTAKTRLILLIKIILIKWIADEKRRVISRYNGMFATLVDEFLRNEAFSARYQYHSRKQWWNPLEMRLWMNKKRVFFVHCCAVFSN